MKRLQVIFAALVALCVRPAGAVEPFNGCSFWNGRLASSSWECAAFNISYGSCTIVHCSPFGCVEYQGELFTGYMPDYFLEVTNRAGKSAFTTSDAPYLSQQMRQAATSWRRGSSPGWMPATGDRVGLRTTREHPRQASQFSFWFGRALAVPYGPMGWSLDTMGFTAGKPAPTCFLGITEFAAETWLDKMDSGDRELAARWAPITAPVCTVGAPVLGGIAAIPVGAAPPDTSDGCAFKLTPAEQHDLAVTGKSAYDPTKQCMGVLGGLLPRSGYTDGDDWTASQRVAWRTASLAEDYFGSAVGVYPGDKWQVIWPRISMPRCFAPGSLLRPTTADPASVLERGPGYDTGTSGKPVSEFVYAVWRRRTKCLEPWDAPGVQVEISSYQAREAALCAGMNASAGGP